MSRIVEFMGLPGAGKSTLASVLIRESSRKIRLLPEREAVIRCLRRRDDGMLGNFLKCLPTFAWEPFLGSRHALEELHLFATGYGQLFQLIFEITGRSDVPADWRQSVLYTFFKRCSERQLLDAHLISHEYALVEEGFAMGALSMACLSAESCRPEDLDNYLSMIPLPSIVFWVDADPLDCLTRLRQRPKPPLVWEGCSDSELLERLMHGRNCFEKTAASLERRNIEVYQIPNRSGAIEDARRIIADIPMFSRD